MSEADRKLIQTTLELGRMQAIEACAEWLKKQKVSADAFALGHKLMRCHGEVLAMVEAEAHLVSMRGGA
jgi:hypothetical protein